jgi:hypothetical protein
MFMVLENLSYTSDVHSITNVINMGIVHLVNNIQSHNFYIYDEGSIAGEVGDLNGTQIYGASYRPFTVNWYANDNKLRFKYNVITDVFPISTLECILRNVIDQNNINVNGNVAIIDSESYSIYYYNVINNKIYKHNNKSIDLSKFYELTVELYDNIVPQNNEFIDILKRAFPQDNYLEYLEEGGIINFTKILIEYV